KAGAATNPMTIPASNSIAADSQIEQDSSNRLNSTDAPSHSRSSDKPRIAYLTTAPEALRNLCDGQLAYLREQGYDVVAISSPGADLDLVAERERIRVAGIPMQREIRPLADVQSLWRLWRWMRRMRPDIVIASTAKAGLLGLMAARFSHVPVRIYLL